MPQITVTDRACEVIMRYAQREFRGTTKRQNDGRVLVEISGTLHDELKSQHFPGETLSAVILRFIPSRAGSRR